MTCTLHAKEAFIVFLPIPLLFIEHVRNFETNKYIFDLLKPHFRLSYAFGNFGYHRHALFPY